MSDDIYELYAVRYARAEGRVASQNFMDGDDKTPSSALDFFVWAAVNQYRTVIVDSGFDEKMSLKRNRPILRPIAEGLKAIGIAPDTVEDVIISHLHYDHAGNHDVFPRAHYHLQDCEMAYAAGPCMCDAKLRVAFEAEDVTAMISKVYADRVTFYDGEAEVKPGITVHHIGGHSKGLQAVRVRTARGHVVLASDATHLYENIEKDRVFPITYNAEDTRQGYVTLRKLASSMDHLIPGHDPLVLERYPAPNSTLQGIAARLDVAPKT